MRNNVVHDGGCDVLTSLSMVSTQRMLSKEDSASALPLASVSA
jgi:hypothetical protein